MLKLELNITIHEKKEHKRSEMFNLRNKLFQKQFKDFITNTNRFTKCFFSSRPAMDNVKDILDMKKKNISGEIKKCKECKK